MEDFLELEDLAGIGGGAAAGTYLGTSIGGPACHTSSRMEGIQCCVMRSVQSTSMIESA